MLDASAQSRNDDDRKIVQLRVTQRKCLQCTTSTRAVVVTIPQQAILLSHAHISESVFKHAGRKTIYSIIFRKIRIARYASVQTLQGRLAEGIPTIERREFLSRKNFGILLLRTANISMKRTNLDCNWHMPWLFNSGNYEVSRTIPALYADRKTKYTDNSWEFNKACEDLNRNHGRFTPH